MTQEITGCDRKSKSLRVILRHVLLSVSRLAPGDFSIGAEMGKTGEGARRGGGPDPGLSSADLQANVQ